MAGFLSILGEDFNRRFRNRIINVHPSLIPAFCGKGYYGLIPHQKVLEHGVKVTGATVHFVELEADAGPIILQKAVEVREDDTPESLQKRVMEEAEWVILPEAIRLFAAGRLVVEGRRVKILGNP
jgi:phosphoribosylglycinamide formyltransferase-1